MDQRKYFRRSENIAQWGHWTKVITRLKGSMLENGVISVSLRFRKQKLEVMLCRSNSTHIIVARSAEYPYASLT
jgi:hypothetical protein